jgi:ribosomal protein S18 acetylase RimI-like enzyme
MATPDDAEFIADLSRKTFYETFAGHNTAGDMNKFLDEQFTRKKLIHEVSDPKNIFFFVCSGEEVMGYTKLKESATPVELGNIPSLEIARIYVLEKSIGSGVGAFMMQQCIDIAGKKNKNLLWLGVWEHNTRALNFYKRWGFEIFGEQDFLLGDDVQKDWLMKKELV